MLKKIIMLFFVYSTVLRAREEKRIVVDIPSYNNSQWYKKNLDSVFEQEYDNYHVIYTDDCSSDGTGNLVEKYIKARGQEHRVTLIKNPERRRSLANHYRATHRCNDSDIIICLDGDDFFNSKHLFSYINRVYDDPNIWLTFGQFVNWPTMAKGYCKPFSHETITKNNYREDTWRSGHLRTYRAWLAKEIKLEDCLSNERPYQGKFFPAAADLALMYPMLEMSGFHSKFLSDVLYIRNVATELNNFKVCYDIQQRSGYLIRHLKRYALRRAPVNHVRYPVVSDIVLFSYESPEVLQKSLKKIKNSFKHYNTLAICYKAQTQEQLSAYKKMAQLSKHVFIDAMSYQAGHVLQKFLKNSVASYVYISLSSAVCENLDLGKCCYELEKTFAYAFYCNVAHNSSIMPPHELVDDDVYAWQFQWDAHKWQAVQSINNAVYRKRELLKILESKAITTIETFMYYWQQVQVDLHKVGLFFK